MLSSAEVGGYVLGNLFGRRRNSLNALRLGLASLVIVSHSWWLGAYGPEPAPGGVKLGSWAVLGFFGISGYLITQSRMTSTVRTFWRARLLRIFPGLVACIAAVSFVFAPLSALATGRRYAFYDSVLFFLSNLSAGAPGIALRGIPGSLDGLPDPGAWNGPLWTLFWELVCYAIAGTVLGVLRPELARVALLVPFLAGSAFVFTLDMGWGPVRTPPDWPLVPLLTFLAGSLTYLYRDRISASQVAVGACAVGVIAIGGAGLVPSLIHIPLCVLLLASSLYLPLTSVGSRFDISFGVYIYGWPVQQVLASMGLHTAVPPLLFAAVSLLLVSPVAWLSCRYVEMPARGWFRRWKDPRRAPLLA